MVFERLKPWISTLMFMIAFGILAILGLRDPIAPPGDISEWSGQHERVAGTVISVDEDVDRRHIVMNIPHHGRIRASLLLQDRVQEQDAVTLTCEIQRVEPFDDFRYDRYLALQKVFSQCTRPSNIVIQPHAHTLQSFLPDLRMAIVRTLREQLPEPESSFAAGLLMGGTHGMSDSMIQAFRTTGTSHIIAASGYNVAIVAQVILTFLLAIGLHRKTSVRLAVFLVVGYVVMAGAQSSLVRAGIMGTILLFSRHAGRNILWLNVLLFAAVVMAIPHPQIIWDDVGYQLSFVAVAGLLYIGPRIQKFLAWVPEWFGMREHVSTTLAATLSTAPIVWITFGSVSLRGIMVNVLVLPWIPIAMATSMLVVIASSIGLPSILSLVAWLPLHFVLSVIRFSAREFGFHLP